MPAVGRYVKLIAKEGRGDALAELMLEVARGLSDTPGCELYIINRSASEPETVWVTELWTSQEAIDAALSSEGAQEQIGRTRELMAGAERIDLEPAGGVGLRAGSTG